MLRSFLAALNQWQRNAHLRWRLDNYKFTGKAVLTKAQDRSLAELQQDWSAIATQFISPKCRLHSAAPDVIASPPVFDRVESRVVQLVDESPDSITLEVTGSLNARYRFVLHKSEASWLVHDLLCLADTPTEQWRAGYIV
jgi:hypothetical protein